MNEPAVFDRVVTALDRYGPLARDELVDVIADEYGFGAGDETVASARTLGLVTVGSPHELTAQGELAATVLRGYGIEDLDDLRLSKEDVSTAPEATPSIAARH
ncbi:hypothetical protein SAMN04488066_10355 [Halorubrum aquaticum]|uniref:Uncharacterized protein n=1 Tax=Halorubrum aquaticum TaxID=387340 RepID=A0A1I2ZRX3_9EURY|nr:hypothetical protein [Halorubrum aquaticum]SFH40504.1 hypothetical protein SAMN04488066_10355 [Halorubrum aquaticum]